MYLYIYELKKELEWIKLTNDLLYSYDGITFEEEFQKKINDKKMTNNTYYYNFFYNIFL